MKINVSSSLKVGSCAVLLLVCSIYNRANAQQFLTKIDGWNAYVHLPAEYADSTHKNYPLIIFIPGIGEVGTNASKLLLNGPSKFIAEGASMEFTVNGKIEKPIVISIQPIDSWAPNPFVVNRKVDSILARWRIDPQRINGTGLSMGGQTWQNYVNTGDAVLTNRLASIVAMSAPGPDNGVASMKNFVINGGKWWGFEGTTDYRGLDLIRDVMNSNVPGSARYFQYVGGHCCWNTWYVPTWNQNGESIYTWMLKQKRPAGANITPEANAGSDTSTVALVTTMPLKGMGNDPDGNPISFSWIKLSGPAGGAITNSTTAQPTATGLSVGSYLFELAVTDVLGAISKDTVTINNGNFVLPLQLTQFSGIDKQDHVLLQWTSKDELNTSHFEIEKRSNTQAYRKVTQVAAKGFSSTENKYECKDLSAELGFNYYRLKMIDFDGTFTYSDVLAIQVKKEKWASLQLLNASYVGNAVNIKINSSQQANHALLLTDATGKVLYKASVVINKGINHLTIPAILPIAIYHASILDGHQKVTYSFFVQ